MRESHLGWPRCTHNGANVFCRAGELAQTVYDLNRRNSLKTILRRINLAGKWISVLFPLVTILLLRVRAIQRQFVIFILIADLPRMPAPPPKMRLTSKLTGGSPNSDD